MPAGRRASAGQAEREARGSLPTSRSSRACSDSRCPGHPPARCPPRTRAAGPSRGGGGGAGRLGGRKATSHTNLGLRDSVLPFPQDGQAPQRVVSPPSEHTCGPEQRPGRPTARVLETAGREPGPHHPHPHLQAPHDGSILSGRRSGGPFRAGADCVPGRQPQTVAALQNLRKSSGGDFASHSLTPPYTRKTFFSPFIYLREREREGAGGRTRETQICCSTYSRIHRWLPVCAPTGDGAHSPAYRDDAASSRAPQIGPFLSFFFLPPPPSLPLSFTTEISCLALLAAGSLTSRCWRG